MNTLDLRKKLINHIESTENINLLKDIHKLLGIESDEIEDASYYCLNTEQKEAISIAREEIKSGKYLSDDEANKDIDQWLNE